MVTAGLLCGVYLEARECSYMQPDSNMSKAARAVITPNTTGISCGEFKMSWQDTWPFHPIVFPDDSQSYNNVFLYHAYACRPSLPYFFAFLLRQIQSMLSVSNDPDVLNIYIDLRFVIAVKQFFLKLLKRTIIIHDRCSPNGSTLAWLRRPQIRTNNVHVLLRLMFMTLWAR
jgi:hypothetical protein